MKAEQRVNESRLAGAVGTEQTDCSTAQIAAQVFQNWPATESDTETVQIDYRAGSVGRLKFDSVPWNRSGKCHALFITLCPDNSKRIRDRRPYPSVEMRQCMLTLLKALKFCLLQESRSEKQED